MDDLQPVAPAPEPAPAPVSSAGWRKPTVFAVCLIAVVAIIAAGVLFYLSPSGQRVADAFSLPKELHGATFIVQDGVHTRTAYHWAGWHYVASPLEETLATDSVGGHTAVIKHQDSSPFVLLLDGKQIVQSRAPLGAVALSPDGTKVAYQQLWSLPGTSLATSTHASSTTNTFSFSTTKPGQVPAALADDSAHWEVMYYDTKNTAPQAVGSGVNPVFLSNTALARFTSNGILKYDFAARTDRSISSERAGSSLNRAKASPDRSYIAWFDFATRSVNVMRVGEMLSNKATYQVISPDFSLTNTDMYWVGSTPLPSSMSMIVRQPLAGGSSVVVHRFPQDFPVISISL